MSSLQIWFQRFNTKQNRLAELPSSAITVARAMLSWASWEDKVGESRRYFTTTSSCYGYICHAEPYCSTLKKYWQDV